MAVVATDVPPLPAIAKMPPSRPCSYRSLTILARPFAIVRMAKVLSCFSRNSAMLLPPARATSSLLMSGGKAGSPSTPKSTTMVSSPRSRIRSRTNWYSGPLVSRAPTMTTGLGIGCLLVGLIERLKPAAERLHRLECCARFYNKGFWGRVTRGITGLERRDVWHRPLEPPPCKLPLAPPPCKGEGVRFAQRTSPEGVRREKSFRPDIPDDHRAVVGAGGQARAARLPAYAVRAAGVPDEHSARLDVRRADPPQAHGSIQPGGGQHRAARAEGQAAHRRAMPAERRDHLPGGKLPHEHERIAGTGGEVRAVGREGEAAHPVHVAGKLVKRVGVGLGVGFPQQDVPAARPGGKRLAVRGEGHAPHALIVAAKLVKRLAAAGIPQADG